MVDYVKMVDYHHISSSANHNCSKFVPNIFSKSKCSQCFRTREDHRFAVKEVETQAVVKCGYLFIAPFCDFSSNSNRRSKRWQRRWFVLRNDGQLTYALDEHPDAIPQGSIQMPNIQKIEPAEQITLHEFSFSLYGGSTGDTVDGNNTSSSTNSTYLKGASNEESKAWINALSRFIKPDKLYKSSKTTTTHLLRGDPDGGENNSSPHIKKGWVSILYNNKWQKQWYTLENNILKFYQNQSEEIALQILNVNSCNVTTYDDGGFFCFKLMTITGEVVSLHADSDQARTEWINSLKVSTTPTIITTISSPTSPTPTAPVSGITSCKTYFNNRKAELDKLSKEVIKSQAVQIDNLRTKLNAGFLEIEKLEFSLGRNCDYEHILQAKDEEINELKQSLYNCELTKEENALLAERVNDLTNKLYNNEKNLKVLQKRLQRYKSQSIKDKEVQTDVYQKIHELELKMSKLDGGEVKEGKKTLINAILKLNELDDRIEKAEWYKCTNCELLNNEIECRDERLKELEVCVGDLEVKLGGLAEMRDEFKGEVMQMKNILKSTLSNIETSQSGIVLELMEKHRREILELEIKHDQILAEETQATRAALEVLKKNHDVELQRQMSKFRAEYLDKMKSNIDLDEVIESQESQLEELKQQVMDITDKYTDKCVQLLDLEKELEEYREKDEMCN